MVIRMTITEFLLARIAEDEQAAHDASPGGWRYGNVESVAGGMLYDETRTIATVFYEQPTDHDGTIVRHLLSEEADANGAHIARHDPARVLAECQAKRAIIGIHAEGWPHDDDRYTVGWEDANTAALLSLAAVYADHPDYDPEWRP